MLEVGTYTRVRDVCQSVATRLQLASWEGCSLFIKIADKVGWAGQGWAGQGWWERRADVWRMWHSPLCTGLGPSLHAGCQDEGRWAYGAAQCGDRPPSK